MIQESRFIIDCRDSKPSVQHTTATRATDALSRSHMAREVGVRRTGYIYTYVLVCTYIQVHTQGPAEGDISELLHACAFLYLM